MHTYIHTYVCMYVCTCIHTYPLYFKSCVHCRRLEQRHKARSARGDFAMQSVAPMEQRREALTEREALEMIFGGIYLQCNKRIISRQINNLAWLFHYEI